MTLSNSTKEFEEIEKSNRLTFEKLDPIIYKKK